MFLTTDIFQKFDKGWPVLTAGTRDSFNMMTVSWGELGTLWGKPVATVFVRESRYTHEFMDREEYFTLSFIHGWYKDTLRMLGTKSGRDIDKLAESGFTVLERPHGISYTNAELILVCRKMFRQRLDPDLIPEDIRNRFYKDGDPHDMYIGEVVEVLSDKYGDRHTQYLFKEGIGSASNATYWRVGMDPENDTYTAELRFGGAGGSMYWLYEINKDIYDRVGTFENDDYKSERLIKEEGRELFRSENCKSSMPFDVVSDDRFREICPWASIVSAEGKEY